MPDKQHKAENDCNSRDKKFKREKVFLFHANAALGIKIPVIGTFWHRPQA